MTRPPPPPAGPLARPPPRRARRCLGGRFAAPLGLLTTPSAALPPRQGLLTCAGGPAASERLRSRVAGPQQPAGGPFRGGDGHPCRGCHARRMAQGSLPKGVQALVDKASPAVVLFPAHSLPQAGTAGVSSPSRRSCCRDLAPRRPPRQIGGREKLSPDAIKALSSQEP
jgi:hypothetical protein